MRFGPQTGDERHRRIALSAIAAVFAKVMGLLGIVVSVPAALGYLGPERFGMWTTFSSAIALVGFADLGIGNGLLNAVAEAKGRGDVSRLRQDIASGVASLTAIAVVLACVFLAVHPFIPWVRLANIQSDQAAREAGPTMLVLGLLFCAGIVTTAVQRVEAGLQEAYIANVWQAVGSLLGLCSLLTAVHLRAGLPWLAFAQSGVPLVVTSLNGAVFYRRRRDLFAGLLHSAAADAARRIVRRGLLFFVLQLNFAIGFTSDNLIVSQALGAQSVAMLSVPVRMFAMIGTIVMMFLMPLWPAYGEALASGDRRWVRQTLIRSLAATACASALAAAALAMFGREILALWVGHQVEAPTLLLVALAAWSVLECCGSALAMFLNGCNVVREQVVVSTVFALTSLAIKIVLVPRLGVAGIPIGTICAYVVTTVIPYALIVPRLSFMRAAPEPA